MEKRKNSGNNGLNKTGRSHAKWSQEALVDAMKTVDEGQSVKSAARQHGIPRKTLSDYLKRDNGSQKLRTGPRTVFSKEQEEELVTRIKRLQKVGFPLTRNDIRRTAYELAQSLNIAERFGNSGNASKLAGNDWFCAFMKRHNDLSRRKTEILSYGRGAGLNRTVVSEFYAVLLKTVTDNKIDPHCIFNMDESGLQLTTRQGSVIAEKGSKRVPQLSSGEKGETVSIVACCSATGVFLPPYVIFKGKRRKEELGDGLPPGSAICMTDSGYAQTHTFKLFIEFFVKHKPSEKTVLIMDGHRSHVDAESVAIAELNNVSIILLPAHTSHELQPLDKAVFKSLKAAYYEQCRFWHLQHPGRALNKAAFSHVFTPAWNKCASRENAVNGFRATGIYPLNPHAVVDSAFAPSEPSERPEGPTAAQPSITTSETMTTSHVEPAYVFHPASVTAESAGICYTFEIPAGTDECILDTNIEQHTSDQPGSSIAVQENGESVSSLRMITPTSSSVTTAILRCDEGSVARQRTPNAAVNCVTPTTAIETDTSFYSLLQTPKIVRRSVSSARSANKRAVVLSRELFHENVSKQQKNRPKKKRLESEAETEKSMPKKVSKKHCSDRQKQDRPKKKRLESEAVTKKSMPKKVSKRSGSEHCRGKTKSSLISTSDIEPCNLCKRLYDDPDFDSFPWGQCMKCMKWYHDICDDTCYVTGICKLC